MTSGVPGTGASRSDLGPPDASVEEPGRSAPRCEVCGDAIASSLRVDCLGCGTPHHRDCFAYVGQCSVYGCNSRRGKANPGYGATAEPDIVSVRDTSSARKAGQRGRRSEVTRSSTLSQPLPVEAAGRRYDSWTSLRIVFKRLVLCGVGALSMASACSSAIETPGQALFALLFGGALMVGGLVSSDKTILKLG